MHCENALEWMSAALDGELSPKERRELDDHLAHCPTCAQSFRELSGQSRLLRQLDCQPPADLSASILSALPPQAPRAKKNIAPLVRRWGTVAACLVLVAVGAFALTGPMGAKSADMAAFSVNGAAPPAAQYATGAAAERSMAVDESDKALYETETAQDTLGTDVASIAEESVENAEPAEAAPDITGGADGSAAPAEITAPEENSAPETTTPAQGNLNTGTPLYPQLGSGEQTAEAPAFTRTRLEWSEALVSSVRLVAGDDVSPAWNTEGLGAGPFLAVTLTENSGSIGHEVQEIRAADDGGWEIVIRRIVPQAGTCDMAAWLILIETDLPISPDDPISVTFTF